MPSQSDPITSLASAADAAHQVYILALTKNPGADLSSLWTGYIAAQTQYLTALNKTFTGQPAALSAQSSLDAETAVIKGELVNITNIATWVSLVSNLVKLSTAVAQCFV